jgi:hypothetical protein
MVATLEDLEVVIEAIAGREEPGLDPRSARPQRVRGVTRYLASSAWLVMHMSRCCHSIGKLSDFNLELHYGECFHMFCALGMD